MSIKTISIGLVLIIALIALVSWGKKAEAPANGMEEQTAETETGASTEFMITNGLTAEIITEGNGAEAKAGNTVSVHYTGWLTNGIKFDSSVDRGQPFSFTLGVGQVIAGWDQGVVGMKVGEKRKLTIAPELGYGATGAGGAIPPNATLVFEVELLAIQ